jgi:protein-L-isoaspartate(D-aspartate) O-methyltransferase
LIYFTFILALTAPGCRRAAPPGPPSVHWEAQRREMVQVLEAYGITNPAVLAAMGKIQRHLFIPEAYRDPRMAYANGPAPIGHNQTISQPFIVAYMTERLNLRPGEKVLEIGTGSGYQAAVLGELGAEVYTIEIVAPLGEQARERLARMGYDRVHVRVGDGNLGWPEAAPFDGIVVTAAGPVPPALVEQLKPDGRLVMPVGVSGGDQELVVITRNPDGSLNRASKLPVRFVPLTGNTSGRGD